MGNAVKVSDSEMQELRKAAALQSRSLAGQAEHWMRLGRAFETNPLFGYAKVEQALKALVSPDELTTDEQELYFDNLASSHWEPSPTETQFFESMMARGGAVGMDEAGSIVVGVAHNTKAL